MNANTTTLKNDFHQTEITVLATSAALLDRDYRDLARSQKATVRRISAKLCGAKGCECGVVRGPQS